MCARSARCKSVGITARDARRRTRAGLAPDPIRVPIATVARYPDTPARVAAASWPLRATSGSIPRSGGPAVQALAGSEISVSTGASLVTGPGPGARLLPLGVGQPAYWAAEWWRVSRSLTAEFVAETELFDEGAVVQVRLRWSATLSLERDTEAADQGTGRSRRPRSTSRPLRGLKPVGSQSAASGERKSLVERGR